ncbi:cobalt-precorrin-5B (C(1))-methyltransferase CbiD [Thermohalobacter berrensis]|uniref:Cobalt-precorrin-5B C(1)-methyltransferase n=1 Tax=Thermohalobacter berrensis TaxID=99594 RepID=A0A419SZF3_9FIRM|nr:cobalt-precorrin-5B (C(1))-methyltransferase CbiD [Thermohalobacter berrensis]RKD30596.1 cobalt-precorrin-5B (C(1))-methyltransferase [Thermohalobacter berrensis]
MERYIIKKGKKLRYGYTTGTCAAAAAKAATKMLYLQEKINNITINTPKGWNLTLDIKDIEIKKDCVSCCVIKDSGDDSDVTDGIKIYAKAERKNDKGIEITGGIGIGKVTKPGLSVPVGKPAINPVPMKMIKEEVKKVLHKDRGVTITIYAPEGVKIAEKTFNPNLGIIGGISIIGTTGIVEPMSEEAFKDSLALELSILKEEGVNKAIFAPGNYGRDFAKKISLKEDYVVKTSNFIGFMLEKAVEYGIEETLWIGHIGKLVKVAGGIFNTHSKVADGRMEILAAYYGLMSNSKELIGKILECKTTEEAVGYILNENNKDVFKYIAERVSKRCENRVKNKLKVGTLLFSNQYGILGICPYGKKLLEEFKNE